MKLALYQPDIAQNAGAAIRLCACLGVPLEVIEPCGFPFGERTLRRTAMDYTDHVQLTRHADWSAFETARKGAGERLLLLSTRAEMPYHGFAFRETDILLLGRESAGVPDHVH
ncbi:MAG: TrmH family RNA methyltransferase, partial [Alphaproteobacteria bacterium]|nr:TrmH family RNA methyltransferase [Alphaproteobacteria bacterium]